MVQKKDQSSFRDPSGFVFIKDSVLFRQINKIYRENYELLLRSGLYEKLTKLKYLIPHTEVSLSGATGPAYKIIKPVKIPFISYPYEWSFQQLKDAALLTLAIQRQALECGMSLKDTSSFNIQFMSGKPVFIDTLSFEKYEEGRPWIAYRQFCEQFLAPLALACFCDIRINRLLLSFCGNIPLDLTVKLLPMRAKISPAILMHLVLHAQSQKDNAGKAVNIKSHKLSRRSLLAILDSLTGVVSGLTWRAGKTVWTDYGEACPSYTASGLLKKKELVEKYIKTARCRYLWDIGANTGEFSRIAARNGAFVLSLDNDPTVVDKNYRRVKKEKLAHILPLWVDILNPTPATGWHNGERLAFLDRPKPDTVLALALIHHLAIANNLSIPMLARFFSTICKTLIIEFIPKEDRQVKLLLQNREDIFPDYKRETFEKEFSRFFALKESAKLPQSERILYLWEIKIHK